MVSENRGLLVVVEQPRQLPAAFFVTSGTTLSRDTKRAFDRFAGLEGFVPGFDINASAMPISAATMATITMISVLRGLLGSKGAIV